jgi:hypothetical protein
MTSARAKDVNWTLNIDLNSYRTDQATLAVLMDIRDELKGLRRDLELEKRGLIEFPTREEGVKT